VQPDLTRGRPCATDSLVSEQCSFSEVICGTVLEVYVSRSEIPVTKDITHTANLQELSRDMEIKWRTAEVTRKKNLSYKTGKCILIGL